MSKQKILAEEKKPTKQNQKDILELKSEIIEMKNLPEGLNRKLKIAE